MKFLVFLAAFSGLVMACTHRSAEIVKPTPPATTCTYPALSFNNDIEPIFKHTCAKSGCHDGNNMPHDFSVYSELLPSLNDSALYYYVIKDRTMPQDTPLTADEYRKVQCWLTSGHPER